MGLAAGRRAGWRRSEHEGWRKGDQEKAESGGEAHVGYGM